MNRYLMLLLCLSLLYASVFGVVVSADDSITVRVGIYENSPKIFTDEEGNASGFWPDIIEYIASEEGWEIDYIPGTWTQCLQRLEQNEIDMMPDVAYTEERSKLYDFSNETVYVSWSRVYAREGTDIQSILDLEGKNIAVLEGSVNVEGPEGIKELVRRFGINCTFTEVDSYIRVFELMESGETDAGVVSKDFGHQHEADFNVAKTAIIFQPAALYFAFPKKSSLKPYLIERIDHHMKELKEDENSTYYQSLGKWLGVKPIEKAVVPGWMLWALAGIGGLALLLAGGSYILRSQVRARTKELTAEITEHKRAEEQLRQSEQKLRLMFESVAEGITVSDLEANIVQVNDAVVTMHGYHSREELVGRSAFDLIAERDHPKARENMEKTWKTGRSGVIEYTLTRKDGSEFPAELSAAILRDASGKPAGFVAVTQDTTERRKMEEQLIITDRLASVGELAAGIAHELNNPLTSIIGFSDLLLQKDMPGDVREDMQVVNREAKRTADVVKNLLTFARKHEAEKAPTNINRVIESVLALRAYEHKVCNIEVKADLTPDLPEIMADGFKLQQVFLNIIINAEYFMTQAHGKGTLTINTKRVGDTVQVSFADDGPGIPKENLAHLFDPFFTTKEVGVGTGLGLSISHGIIAEHGGRIYAESKVGKGTNFIVELPITQ